MLHLPLAHHETSKRESPNETKIKVKQPKCPRFEFEPRQVNDSSQSNQGTDHLVSQTLMLRVGEDKDLPYMAHAGAPSSFFNP
jgi:TATA-binding protein-associated factor Taf7